MDEMNDDMESPIQNRKGLLFHCADENPGSFGIEWFGVTCGRGASTISPQLPGNE